MTMGHHGIMAAPAVPAAAEPRLALLDVLRGAAVVLMILYHGMWDADYLGLLPLPLFTATPWLVARAAILALFLLSAGISLILAHDGGFRRRAFVGRLVIVGGGALLITLSTYLVFRDGFVSFGVLHHIVVASVIGVALLRVTIPGILVLAAAAFLLPWGVDSALFDSRWLAWTGLAASPPYAVDHVPLLPWFGVFLAGMAAGRAVAAAVRGGATAWSWRPPGAAGDLICWLGRHSLAVYLIHQPVLLGMLWLLAAGGIADGRP